MGFSAGRNDSWEERVSAKLIRYAKMTSNPYLYSLDCQQLSFGNNTTFPFDFSSTVVPLRGWGRGHDRGGLEYCYWNLTGTSALSRLDYDTTIAGGAVQWKLLGSGSSSPYVETYSFNSTNTTANREPKNGACPDWNATSKWGKAWRVKPVTWASGVSFQSEITPYDASNSISSAAGPNLTCISGAGGITLTPLCKQWLCTGATNANPIVITTDQTHNLVAGQSVTISGVAGNTNANGTYTIASSPAVTGTTFALQGRAGNGAFSSSAGSVVQRTETTLTSAVTWSAGTWYDIVYWFDGTSTYLSVNGETPVSAVCNNPGLISFSGIGRHMRSGIYGPNASTPATLSIKNVMWIADV